MIIPAEEHLDLKRGIDYIGVTICFIIHDGNGKILLQKRGQNARDEQGRWDVGGGAVEFGETLEAAVRREVKEEVLADAKSVRFLKSGENHRIHNGAPTHWIYLLHAVLVDPSDVGIGEPHKVDAIGWYGLDDLPSPRHSTFDVALEAAKAEGLIK